MFDRVSGRSLKEGRHDTFDYEEVVEGEGCCPHREEVVEGERECEGVVEREREREEVKEK